MHERLTEGKEYEDVASALREIGMTLSDMGQYAEALEYHKRELSIYEKLHDGKDHNDIADTLLGVGVTLHKLENFHDALDFKLRALHMWERLYQDIPNRNLVASFYTISDTLRKLELNKEALKYNELELRMAEGLAEGKDSADVTRPLRWIGLTLLNMGQYTEALEYHNKTLEMRERLAEGKDHITIADSYLYIGITLHSLGRYQEAIDIYDKALLIHEAADNTQNKVNCADCLSWKAISLTALDKLPEAIEILHTACTLDPSATNTRCLAQAYSLSAFKNPTNHEAAQKAEKYFREALTISNEASIHTYYAGFLYTQKRSTEAIEEWERALQSPKANEEINPRILAIGSVIPCIQEEIKFLRVFRSTSHLLAHCSLVIAYQQQSNLPKAQYHLTQLTEAINTHEPTHTNYSLLGYAHKALGNPKEAHTAFKKAYELYPTQPHAPEYTLAKKNMLEQEQLLARNASGEAAAIYDPSSTPTITQTALIPTDLTSEQTLQ